MTTTTTRPAVLRVRAALHGHDRANRWDRTLRLIGVVGLLTSVFVSRTTGQGLDPLRVEGRHFVDPAGRVVILRGLNLTGDAKVPPFLPNVGPGDLDRMASLGMNVIRMLFLWEAYEPSPGQYDEDYLEALRRLAAEAAARGIYTIVDIHQDGFSRHTSRGAGDGFPAWAVSRRGTPSRPDNSPSCRFWPVMMATDRTTHRSFDDFFADVDGVRGRFIRMVDRVACGLAPTPGVIGYDLMNEPWGDERRELSPLYREMEGVIRRRHPSAILFVEGHVTTNCGKGTRLANPSFGGFAYAPHYYKPLALVLNGWRGTSLPINHAFSQMTGQSERWDCPLFLGEFGVAAGAKNAGAYVDAIYDRLDASLASGAQWNLTPGWDALKKDGWNGEDFSIVDAAGNLRPNFRPRPYPRLTAGTPTRFEYREGHPARGGRALLFTWDHHPERGETVIALPDGLFRPGTRVETTPSNVEVHHDPARRALVCRASFAGPITLRVSEPTIRDRAEPWRDAVAAAR